MYFVSKEIYSWISVGCPVRSYLIVAMVLVIAIISGVLCFAESASVSYVIYGSIILDDGSIVCVGSRIVGRNYEGLIVRLSPEGRVLWAVSVDGPGYESFRSCIVSSKGTVWAVGYTTSFGEGSYDVLLVEISLNGSVLKAYAVGGKDADIGQDLIETEYGLIVVGYTSSYGAGGFDLFFFKISEDGNIVWAKALGDMKYDDVGKEICRSPEGGYLIVGDTWGFGVGMDDYFLVKIDESGHVEWTKTIGGGGYDEVSSVLALSDGFLIVGSTWSYGWGYDDVFIVRTDIKGNVLWALTIGGEEHDVAAQALNVDGIYAVAGATSSFGGGDYDCFIVLVKEGGAIVDGICLGSGRYETTRNFFLRNSKYLMLGYSSALRKNFKDIMLAELSLDLEPSRIIFFMGGEGAPKVEFTLTKGAREVWAMWAKNVSVEARPITPFISGCRPSVTDVTEVIGVNAFSLSTVQVSSFRTGTLPKPIPWLRELKLFIRRNFAFIVLIIPCIAVVVIILWLKFRRK